MKKIILLALILFLSIFTANSQVLLSENFDTALNWTVAHPAGTSTDVGHYLFASHQELRQDIVLHFLIRPLFRGRRFGFSRFLVN